MASSQRSFAFSPRPMRNPPFVLLLALIWAPLALKCSARIGETREQCDQRYGAPTGVEKNAVFYFKNGITIQAIFSGGECCAIYYLKVDENGVNTPFSEEELKELLAANSLDGKRKWKLLKENVWTSDDAFEASVYENALFMIIQSKAKPNALEGF